MINETFKTSRYLLKNEYKTHIRLDPHGGLLLWMLHFLDSKHIVQNSLKGWFEQWQNWQYQGFYFFAFFSLFSFFSRFFHFFSLNFRFASIFSLNFRLFYLRFRFRFLVFRIEVNHVKSGFFFASKRSEIFASISNFASEVKVRAHPSTF